MSGWKTVLEKTFKHMKGFYYVLMDEKGETIRAGLPVYFVDSWLTGKRIVSIPFATLCDPLISKKEDLECLMHYIIKLHHDVKSCFIELRTFQSYSLFENVENYKFSHLEQFKYHYLPLSSDPLEVKKKFHQKSVRSAINKAARSPLNLNSKNSARELNDFYKLYFNTRKKLKLPPQPYRFIKNIWEEFSPSGHFHVILANYKDKPIAALALFKFKNRISTEFAGWDTKFGEFKPNHYLYWEAIKMGCEENHEIFDFGRTSTKNQGLRNFKKRWGTVEVFLPQFYYPSEIHRYIVDDQQSMSRKVIQKLLHERTPDFVAKIIGDFCYRHLG